MTCSVWGTPGEWQAEDLVIFQAVKGNQRGDGNGLPQRDGYGLFFHHLSQYKKQEALREQPTEGRFIGRYRAQGRVVEFLPWDAADAKNVSWVH